MTTTLISAYIMIDVAITVLFLFAYFFSPSVRYGINRLLANVRWLCYNSLEEMNLDLKYLKASSDDSELFEDETDNWYDDEGDFQ